MNQEVPVRIKRLVKNYFAMAESFLRVFGIRNLRDLRELKDSLEEVLLYERDSIAKREEIFDEYIDRISLKVRSLVYNKLIRSPKYKRIWLSFKEIDSSNVGTHSIYILNDDKVKRTIKELLDFLDEYSVAEVTAPDEFFHEVENIRTLASSVMNSSQIKKSLFNNLLIEVRKLPKTLATASSNTIEELLYSFERNLSIASLWR